jgi:DNA-binding transcriptional MerR regulator
MQHTPIEAIDKGRSVTIGPQGISVGEFEDPSVKKCRMMIDNYNGMSNSIQHQIETLTKLLTSQEENINKAIVRNSEFLQKTDAEVAKESYSSTVIEKNLVDSIGYLENFANSTKGELGNTLEPDLIYLQKLESYCANIVSNKN